MALLAEHRLNPCIVSPKRCELFLRHFDVLTACVQTVPLPQFFGEELEFALRASSEFRVRTVTGAPAAINVGKPHADGEPPVTHLTLGSFSVYISHPSPPPSPQLLPPPHSASHL